MADLDDEARRYRQMRRRAWLSVASSTKQSEAEFSAEYDVMTDDVRAFQDAKEAEELASVE